MLSGEPSGGQGCALGDRPYAQLCREERNHVAVLYAALLRPDNLVRFLRALGFADAVDPERAGVFVEYACLRDLWAAMPPGETTQALRRRFILEALDVPEREDLWRCPIADFNRAFGVGGPISPNEIQYPGRWAVTKLAAPVPAYPHPPVRVLRAVAFKWAFNIKPDLVIEPAPGRAICVEAKVGSGEGSYPATDRDIAALARVAALVPGLADGWSIQQVELQSFLMCALLRKRTDFVYLVGDAAAAAQPRKVVSWARALAPVGLARGADAQRSFAVRMVTWGQVVQGIDMAGMLPGVRGILEVQGTVRP